MRALWVKLIDEVAAAAAIVVPTSAPPVATTTTPTMATRLATGPAPVFTIPRTFPPQTIPVAVETATGM
jgi:hypothetical protein